MSMKREVSRIKAILSYGLTGQRVFECCDIPTRQAIECLVQKILRIKIDLTA